MKFSLSWNIPGIFSVGRFIVHGSVSFMNFHLGQFFHLGFSLCKVFRLFFGIKFSSEKTVFLRYNPTICRSFWTYVIDDAPGISTRHNNLLFAIATSTNMPLRLSSMYCNFIFHYQTKLHRMGLGLSSTYDIVKAHGG